MRVDKTYGFICHGCGRKIEIRKKYGSVSCPHCHGINKVNLETGEIDFIPKEMARRTTSSGMVFGWEG